MNSTTIPVVVGSNRQQKIYTIVINQGNTVLAADTYYGTIYGAKIPTSGVTAVPTATPSPTAGGTYTNGLCCGTLFNGSTTSYVWVCLKAVVGSTTVYDTLSTLVEGMIIESRYKVQLPITGGGGAVANVYIPWYIG